MKEKKIEEAVELEDAPIQKTSGEEFKVGTNTGRQIRKLDPSLVNKARSIYITTEKSMDQIALELGINKFTLYRYSRKEKWALLKQNPEFNSWSRELVDEVYTSINFFSDAKNVLHNLLMQEQFQNPKDIKMMVEAFKVADERTTNLRLLKENVNKDEDDTYEE